MTTTYSAEVLVDSPVAYWRLEDSGASVVSEVGAGLSGTFFGTVTTGVAGNAYRDTPNLAMTFTGALVGYLVGPSSPAADVLNPHLGSMTWEVLFRSTATGGVTFYSRHTGASVMGIIIRLNTDALGRVGAVVNNAISVDSGAGVAYNDGQIHHVAVVLTRTTHRLLLYVDGTLCGNTDAASQAAVDLSSTSNGEWGFLSSAGETQTMARLAVYATALSAARIAVHAAAVMPNVVRLVREAIQIPTIGTEVLRAATITAEAISTPTILNESITAG